MDAFGQAIRDEYLDERSEPLLHHDGDETIEHPIAASYFAPFDPSSPLHEWMASWLQGPLLDLGAGTGRHARYFQQLFETVAVEPSPALVETMRDRGVEDARVGDMFRLRETFDRDRFRSALSNGTQIGLAGSMCGLTEFLGELAYVTTSDATAVIDGYDPTHPSTTELIGYRDDPTPGLAHRVMYFSYEGDTDPIHQLRLFSPDRFREATIGTGWTVADVVRGGEGSEHHYRVALEKR